MARPYGCYASVHPAAKQAQVSQEIEGLVKNEFPGVAQPFRVDDGRAVADHCAIEAATAGESGRPQTGKVATLGERARVCDGFEQCVADGVADGVVRGVGDKDHSNGVATDSLVWKVNAQRKVENRPAKAWRGVIGRLDGDGGVAVSYGHAAGW